jgi:hypothetical protein
LYSVLPSVPKDAIHIAKHMRHADVVECKVFNKTPLQAINTAMLMKKNQTLTLYKDNEPLLIGGVVPESSKVATIWVLSTEKAFNNPVTIGKMAVKWVNYVATPYEKVHNLVWIENKKAINLLILLGFYINPKVIHVNNTSFYYFVRRNTQ